MSRRIIFVGVHYKPGMAAFDSRTKSGAVIDYVIDYLKQDYKCDYVKSNLIMGDGFPENYNPELEAHQWAIREKYKAGDIIIALGFEVQKAFRLSGHRFVYARHPSRVGDVKAYAKNIEASILKSEINGRSA